MDLEYHFEQKMFFKFSFSLHLYVEIWPKMSFLSSFEHKISLPLLPFTNSSVLLIFLSNLEFSRRTNHWFTASYFECDLRHDSKCQFSRFGKVHSKMLCFFKWKNELPNLLFGTTQFCEFKLANIGERAKWKWERRIMKNQFLDENLANMFKFVNSCVESNNTPSAALLEHGFE